MQWIVSSSVLILVVIALRYVLRGKLSLRMQYALWLLVLVRLLVPVSFGASDLSVMNAVPERAPTVQQGTYKQDIVGERNDAPANAGTVGVPAQSMNEAAPPNLVQNVTTATVTAPTVEKTDWARIAKTVWLAGAAALGLVFLAVNLRFGKKLRRSRERVEETDACLPVYESGETDTPCLFGVAKPSIYVTPDTRTEAETLRYALAHEQTHYRHGDNLWAVLRGVVFPMCVTSSKGASARSPQPMRHSMAPWGKLGLVKSAQRSPASCTAWSAACAPGMAWALMTSSFLYGRTSRS